MPRSPQDDLLATDFGLEALHEAAFDRGLSIAAWPSPADAGTLVSWLLARESDPDVATVLRLARIRVRYRGPAEARVAFVGKKPRAIADPERVARDLEKGLARALGERGFPGVARVTVTSDAKSARFSVLLPSRWMRLTTEMGARTLGFRESPATLSFAPGRLDVSAAHPPHVALLAREIGSAAFGDATFFRPASLVALRPFQRGSRAFKVPRALASEIALVRMIECEWDSGHSVNVSFSGADCPKDMKKLGLHIEGGELLGTTIRFNFKTAPPHADVTLRPPNELTCSEPSREPLVLAFFEAKKVLTREKPPVDLWSLDPWTPSDEAARAFFGEAFDALVEEKILAPSTTRAVVHPDHPAAGRRLIAFPIPGEAGRWYGATDGLRFPARTLRARDLVSWTLKMIPLGKRIARAVGLEGRVRVLERRGVVDLGALRMGHARARFFLVTRTPLDPKGLAERLRRLAVPGHVVLVVPTGRSAGTDLAEVELARVEGPYDGLIADAARALGLAEQIDPMHLAPPGTRLVVHEASKRVWFDGVLIHPLREQSYRLVEILAKLAGAAIGAKKLAEMISGGANVEGATAQAKHGLKLAIAASFAREGREVPRDASSIVERVRKGEVRMGVTAFLA
jgi:hypothetical protein